MHVQIAFLSLLAASVSTSAFQSPLVSNLAVYDTGLLNRVDDIRTLSTNGYTTLRHPAHPRYSVRIKRNGAESCDNTVNSYTGYIDIDARHLFFSFFESRSDPSKDDVILWTNGGPGCSSSLNLYMELGPCRIQFDNSTTYNPYSWIQTANIFFIDQPIGVGFSYGDYGNSVSTSKAAAKDVSAFVRIFFDTFTQFKRRNFHLAGISYAGRYLPVFGAQIMDDNAKAVQHGLEPIKLVSLIIGNGLTDAARMPTSYYDIQCTPASVEPFQSIANCVKMKKAIPRCENWLKRSCTDIYDEMGCRAAADFCDDMLINPLFETGRNIFDVSKNCEGGMRDTLCYAITKTLKNYLDQPRVRTELGVDAKVGNFSLCTRQIEFDFITTLDLYAERADYYVAELLERGIKVLIYVGVHDMVCSWLGNQRFVTNLEWSGREKFINQELRDWVVNNQRAGKTRAYGGLTYATVEGAGHFVPYDKPVEALALVSRWLDDKEL